MSVAALVGSVDDIVRSTSVLAEGIEGEFLKFVAYQEECRKKWWKAEDEFPRLRQEIAKSRAEIEALAVKLKHARSQVEIEIKKRQKAETTQDHLERQVALIRELLNDKNANLNDNDRRTLIQLSQSQPPDYQSPRKRPYGLDESSASILSPSDVSFDPTDDDLDISHPGKNFQNGKWRKVLPSTLPDGVGPVDGVSPPKKSKTAAAIAETVIARTQITLSPDRKVMVSACVNTKDDSDDENANPNGRQRTKTFKTPARNTRTVRNTPQNTGGTFKKKKAHVFQSKTVIRPETCAPCDKRIKFGKLALKCVACRAVCHPDCKDRLPLPCVPSNNTPGSGKKGRDLNIEFFAPNTCPLVPQIVVKCIHEIEKRGLSEVGIYRVPGADRTVKQIKEKFLQGKSVDLSKVDDIHVVCGVLKDFLRNLSEPIITFQLWRTFVNAANKSDDDDSLSGMYQAVSELPTANRDTLAFLIVHLQRVTQCPECKMPVNNVAKVFGPTIVSHSSVTVEPVVMLQETKSQPKVVERLLNMPVDYWNQFLYIDEQNVRSPPFNPSTHNLDGTPKTPEIRGAPQSMLGPLTTGSGTSRSQSVKKKGSFLSRTPLTPRFGSKSKHPNKRPQHFFASPMLK